MFRFLSYKLQEITNKPLTASVDGWQTAFSVNGNAVHTRQISVDGDR